MIELMKEIGLTQIRKNLHTSKCVIENIVYLYRIKLRYWNNGQPDNYKGIQHCIHGSFFPNGFWDDFECNVTNAVICELPKCKITEKDKENISKGK